MSKANNAAPTTTITVSANLAKLLQVHAKGRRKNIGAATEELLHFALTANRHKLIKGEPDNNDRADWAQTSVEVFASTTGLDVSGDEMENAIGDLLADMMHLCDREGIDFKTCLDVAEGHYEEEVEEGGKATKS